MKKFEKVREGHCCSSLLWLEYIFSHRSPKVSSANYFSCFCDWSGNGYVKTCGVFVYPVYEQQRFLDTVLSKFLIIPKHKFSLLLPTKFFCIIPNSTRVNTSLGDFLWDFAVLCKESHNYHIRGNSFYLCLVYNSVMNCVYGRITCKLNLVFNTKFIIKSENFAKVIENFREKFGDCETVKIGDVNTIEDVFWEFGYNIIQNENGDIIDLDTVSSDLPDGQEEFFDAIAQYVETGSYIELKREDEYWKYVFEKWTMHRLDGEIIYHEESMSYKNLRDILDACIEYACNQYRVREVITFFLASGCTKEDLICMNFDIKDIEYAEEEFAEEVSKEKSEGSAGK